MVKGPAGPGKDLGFTLSEMESRMILSREGQAGAQSFFRYMGNGEGRKTKEDATDVHGLHYESTLEIPKKVSGSQPAWSMVLHHKHK